MTHHSTPARRAARGFAAVTALPLTAALLTVRPAVSEAEPLPPEWSLIGELVTGSATGSGAGQNTGSAEVFEPLGLGPGPSAPAGGYLGTGSSGGWTPIGIDSGATDPAPDDAGVPVEVAAPAADPPSTGSTEALGLDTGSVQAACTGSAAAGSAASLSALVTGSGILGSGSSGSALGSAAVGSAASGSAALTCLLLLPLGPPPQPWAPLEIGPPPPIAPPIVPPPVPPSVSIPEVPVAIPPEPAVPPPRTPLVSPPQRAARPDIEPTADPVAWNLIQFMTIMAVTVIFGLRRRFGD